MWLLSASSEAKRLTPIRPSRSRQPTLRASNPNTGTAPIFRTRRDMALTTAIYARAPVLVDRSKRRGSSKAGRVKYHRMFDMTLDSAMFRTRARAGGSRKGAWPIGGNRWQSAGGEWVPLYEGKMVQAFDHRAASVVVNPENLNRPAQPFPATSAQSADPAWLADPQFWIQPPRGGWRARLLRFASKT